MSTKELAILITATSVVCVLIYMIYRILLVKTGENRDGLAQSVEQHERHAEETGEVETAPWMGSTGLPAADEQQLAKYLRVQLKEPYFEVGSIRAKDLYYMGAFKEDGWRVHYWKVPSRFDGKKYAYIEQSYSGETWTGWGDREPPENELTEASRHEI
jgi:hypothetical protein